MKLRASQSFSYPSFEVKIINIYTTLPRVIVDDFFDDDYIYIYIYIYFFGESRPEGQVLFHNNSKRLQKSFED